MIDGSPWEDVWCEYCGEYIHHSKIDEHKRRAHSLQMEASEILEHPSWRTVKQTVEYSGVILVIVAVLGLIDWRYGLEYWWFGYLMTGLACSILPALIIFHYRAPLEEKERTERAWQTLRNTKVKCGICEENIAWKDYWSHLKSIHPSQVPYEWLRAFSLVVFVIDFLGGMFAVLVLAGTVSDESLAGIVVVWAVSVAGFLTWATYMSQVGERIHIKKMHEQWQNERLVARALGDKDES